MHAGRDIFFSKSEISLKSTSSTSTTRNRQDTKTSVGIRDMSSYSTLMTLMPSGGAENSTSIGRSSIHSLYARQF